MQSKYAKYIKTGVIIGVTLFIFIMGLLVYGISVGTTAIKDGSVNKVNETVDAE